MPDDALVAGDRSPRSDDALLVAGDRSPRPDDAPSPAETLAWWWFNEHVANSPAVRDVAAANHLTQVALPALIRLLEKE